MKTTLVVPGGKSLASLVPGALAFTVQDAVVFDEKQVTTVDAGVPCMVVQVEGNAPVCSGRDRLRIVLGARLYWVLARSLRPSV